jgi:integrase
MAAIKLTKSAVDSLEPRDKPWIMYDSELKGFGVRIGRSGRKAWVVEYRPGAGGRGVSTKRLKLADTAVLTVDEARKAARMVLAKARLGEDLADQRERDRAMPTVEEFSVDFLAKHVKAKRKPRTLKTYQDHFDRLINPSLGSLKIHHLTPEVITEMHLKIGRENGRGIANRALISLSSMYGWAIKQRKLTTNPVSSVERFPESFQERFLSQEEIAAVGAALIEGETVGIPWDIDEEKPTAKHIQKKGRFTRVAPEAAAAIRLLILTGCRVGEILGLRWDEVDLQRGLIFLPDSKTGKKTVILSSYAMMVLAELPRISPYVIPGRDPNLPRENIRKPWRAVLRRSGIKHCRVHDLRHTNASIAVGMGIGLPIIGKLLGHLSTETTKRYAHLADDPARRATEAIGLNVFNALTGTSGEKSEAPTI